VVAGWFYYSCQSQFGPSNDGTLGWPGVAIPVAELRAALLDYVEELLDEP
jgi:hypothetical protein